MGPGDIVRTENHGVGIIVSSYDFPDPHTPQAWNIQFVTNKRLKSTPIAFWEKDLELLEEKP